jgi:hypothetical protein
VQKNLELSQARDELQKFNEELNLENLGVFWKNCLKYFSLLSGGALLFFKLRYGGVQTPAS